jgi:hypothetical protein
LSQIQQAIQVSGRPTRVGHPITDLFRAMSTAITARRTPTRGEEPVPFDVELHMAPPFGSSDSRSF